MKEQKSDLIMKNISKSFPGVLALDNVTFEATRGKVSSIVGANGAGKSTLMKVLSGVYNTYDGEIFVEGQKLNATSPAIAKKSGIMCVYQEVDTALIPYLSVTENILMDDMAMNKQKGLINWKNANKTCKKILDDMNVQIDEKKFVSELTLSEKQMVLIARAISMEIKFLILDEPTAPLSLLEIDKLFEIIENLKSKNVGIIYISHRLNEVLKITDTVTVMRNGQVTKHLITAETTRNEIIENMLGKAFTSEFPKENVKIGKEIFRVENLKYKNRVRGVSFSLHEGELLGIAGLVGAGKTELSKIIFGAEKAENGVVNINGKKLMRITPNIAVASKVALVPEERRKEGILVDETVTSNLSIANLKEFTKLGFINKNKEKEVARRMVDDLQIKTPSINQQVKHLSGGNQQKIAVGKWLVCDADIYLFDEATKGVDVGSKTEIYKLIGKLLLNNKAVIYLSNELEEIEGIADRVLVMYDGKVVKEMTREEMTLAKMLHYCTGGKDD